MTNIADFASPSTLAAFGLSLSLGYAAFQYINKQPQVTPTSMSATGPQTIVILGGGYAGLPLAHRILKDLVPKVAGLRVILISKSSHLYWNFAAVRGIIPGEFSDQQLFLPIQPGFEKYPKSAFEFVVGSAQSLDVDGNNVLVETQSGPRRIDYTHLIIATGSRLAADNVPFKSLGSHEETVSAWHQLQKQVEHAKSIVIAGAGATGVETAGELGGKYGTSKKITLVINGPRALPTLLESVGKTAEKDLKALGVQLVHNARVDGVEESPDGGKTLTLTNGTTLKTDVYLPLFGVRPNTKFLPPNLLDNGGHVKVQPTLRVRGLNNVWAIGDANDMENKQAMKAGAQAQHIYGNIEAVLTGKPGAVTEYKPAAKPMIFITVGKKSGTGQIGGFKPFNFLVSYVKGRTLFVEKGPGVAAGKTL